MPARARFPARRKIRWRSSQNRFPIHPTARIGPTMRDLVTLPAYARFGAMAFVRNRFGIRHETENDESMGRSETWQHATHVPRARDPRFPRTVGVTRDGPST